MPSNILSKTRKSKFIELENEEQIIQDCLDGDMLALEKLTQHYLSYVYRRVWISIPSSDVDDVTQEVFITVVKKITTFRQESKFSTWLFAITQYKIADYYRKSKKQEKDVAIQDPEFKKRIFLIDNNFDAAKIDNLLLLREGFSEISSRYREILYLRFFHGLSFSEISNSMDLSYEAGKSLFRRAVKALRKQIGEEAR